MENIVEKGEIAHFEQFHLFPQCFPKAFFFDALKWVYMEERVNQSINSKIFCAANIVECLVAGQNTDIDSGLLCLHG